jgi:hypothetical protein
VGDEVAGGPVRFMLAGVGAGVATAEAALEASPPDGNGLGTGPTTELKELATGEGAAADVPAGEARPSPGDPLQPAVARLSTTVHRRGTAMIRAGRITS